eukprot:230952-Hanusia_phi.AAC.1
MSLPEKICSIASNADGSYILAGAETGRVFLWEERTFLFLEEKKREGKGRRRGGGGGGILEEVEMILFVKR